MSEEELSQLEAKRQPCEVFSRVVGYIRPVHQWNKGKQSEYGDRKLLDVKAVLCQDEACC